MAGKYHLPAYFCYRSFWTILDWLYPPVCAGCGASGQRWCSNCQENTTIMTDNVCERCGEPGSPAKICPLCRQAPPAFTAVRSWAVYAGSVRHALHSLKYRQNLALGDSLSVHLINLFRRLNWPVDFIVPVPLSQKRKHSRGYNQAALLARPLSLAVGISYRPNILRRVRDTASQVGLSEKERIRNVYGAFTAETTLAQGKNILVIDDITTTGATMHNCAAALRDAGAQQVYGLTVARAVLETHNDSSFGDASLL